MPACRSEFQIKRIEVLSDLTDQIWTKGSLTIPLS